MKVIDASGAVLGRLASRVAKMLLEGERVTVVNAEKIIITGNPDSVFERFLEKRNRGDPIKGPFYPKRPDTVFRRVVRGMLPYKKEKGRKAFSRLKVYIGNPEGLEAVPASEVSKTVRDIRCKFVTLGDVCIKLGGRW
ncbi:MAG: 50S ribosomal protein L13 [Candidatus Micrarchaeota archaeon]|nr:50S ribosomal protein L13 [Candidatus Micrarchaeota archaeon]